MAFDPSTAREVTDSSSFDPSTAKPVEEAAPKKEVKDIPSMLKSSQEEKQAAWDKKDFTGELGKSLSTFSWDEFKNKSMIAPISEYLLRSTLGGLPGVEKIKATDPLSLELQGGLKRIGEAAMNPAESARNMAKKANENPGAFVGDLIKSFAYDPELLGMGKVGQLAATGADIGTVAKAARTTYNAANTATQFGTVATAAEAARAANEGRQVNPQELIQVASDAFNTALLFEAGKSVLGSGTKFKDQYAKDLETVNKYEQKQAADAEAAKAAEQAQADKSQSLIDKIKSKKLLAAQQEDIPFATSVEEIAARRAAESPQKDLFAGGPEEVAPAERIKPLGAEPTAEGKTRLPEGKELELTMGGKLKEPIAEGAKLPEKTSLESAVEKLSAGKAFDLTATEKVAWDKTKTAVEQFEPEFNKLSDRQISERMMDREWVDQAIQKGKQMDQMYADIQKRMSAEQDIKDMQVKRDKLSDSLDTLEEQLRGERPDTSRKGQGPKTKAAKLSAVEEAWVKNQAEKGDWSYLRAGFTLEDAVQAAKRVLRGGEDFEANVEKIFDQFGETAAKAFMAAYQEVKNGESIKTADKVTTKLSDVEDRLFQVDSYADAENTILRQNAEAAKKAGLTRESKDAILDKVAKGMDIDPAQEAVIDKFFTPLKEEADRTYAEIKKMTPEDAESAMEEYGLGRLATHKGKWKNFVEGLTGGDFGGFGTFGKKPSAMKGRTIFEHNGKVITVNSDGSVFAWKDKVPEMVGTTKTRLKAGDEFKGMEVKDVADQRDIEKNVDGVTYADPFFAQTVKLGELKRYAEQMKAMEQIKESDIFKSMSRKEGEVTPEGYRPITNPQLLPQLRGYSFDPKLAEVFEDYLKPQVARGMPARVLEGASGLAVKSFMLNPIPHIGNEVAHYFVGRGLFSGWVNPKGLAQLANMPESFKSVLEQDKFQIEMAKNGASLMSMRLRNDNWMAKMFREELKIADKNGSIKELAISIGMKPIDLFNKISEKSNTVMWTTRDALYTSMIKERMERFGEDMPAAIQHVEKFMPNYRIPSRVGMDNVAGRAASALMQDKAFTVFSRYHYGMVRAIGESVKDLGKQGKRLEGLDHMAAYAAGLFILYPLIDKMYQAVFGDDVKARRAGGFHLLSALGSVAAGEKRPEAVASSLITPSPGLSTGISLATGKDWYTGKEIRTQGDTLYNQAKDTAKYYLGKQLPMGGVADVAQGKKPLSKFALAQLDIEQETPADKKRKELAKKIQARKLKARQKLRRKEEE